jgi:FAD/FMN-containing dehydrogenase
MPFGAVQQAFDEFFARGTLRSYWKATFVNELTDEIIDILAPRAQNRASNRTFVVLFRMGGAINEVGSEDTAYPEREAEWMVSIDGNWEDPAEDETVISWVRDTWSQVHERGTGSVYLNFTGIADEGVDVGVDSGHSNLDRLREIKKKYDPDNLFRLNNNISPS